MKKSPFTKTEWNKINRRRQSLIKKKCGTGLTSDETQELEDLQKKAERYLKSFEEPSLVLVRR